MENKTDFKPYIPADKVMPEFSVTAAVLGCILAISLGQQTRIWDCGMTVICIDPGVIPWE